MMDQLITFVTTICVVQLRKPLLRLIVLLRCDPVIAKVEQDIFLFVQLVGNPDE